MPQFNAGDTKTAIVTLDNPTVKEFTYDVVIYLDVTQVASSQLVSVTVPAGSTGNVPLSVTMPIMEGVFPVFLDIYYGGALLEHYQASEDVTLVIIPDVVIGPIVWQ